MPEPAKGWIMELGNEAVRKIPKSSQEAIRRSLLDTRRKLMAEISARLFPSEAPITDIGDVVDQAGHERDRELMLLLTDREKGKILAVNEALEKLGKGTYGTCENCGEPISPGRLKAMPLAKLCVICQSGWEREIKLRREEEEGELPQDESLVETEED